MKDIFRTLPVIAVMTTVAACSGGIEEQNPNGPATGDKIRIEFTAEIPGPASARRPQPKRAPASTSATDRSCPAGTTETR